MSVPLVGLVGLWSLGAGFGYEWRCRASGRDERAARSGAGALVCQVAGPGAGVSCTSGALVCLVGMSVPLVGLVGLAGLWRLGAGPGNEWRCRASGRDARAVRAGPGP